MLRALTLALILGGCAGSAEQAVYDDRACRAYGVGPGSETYARCRMALDAERRAAWRGAARSLADGLSAVGRAKSGGDVVRCETSHGLSGMSSTTECR